MHRTSFAFLAAAGSVLVAPGAFARTPAPPSPSAADQQTLVTLTNGDLIRGRLISDGDPVVIDHPVLGRISLPRSTIAGVRSMSPVDAGKATAAATEAAAKVPPPPPPPDPDSFFKGWKGSLEGGVNGSDGNTETLSLRFGVNVGRETSKTKATGALSYNYGTTGGEKDKDNGRLDVRNDWLPQDGGKWRPFVQGSVEYDQFQDWDWRTSAAGGIGYELVKTDTLLVLPRVGLGLSKEYGGSDNKIHPEGLVGLDLEYKIDERSRLFATGDTYWRLDDIPDYRAFGKAGYEILVDPKSGMTLKLGVEDKYDASPGAGKKRNDVTYFALVAIPF